MDYLTKVGRMTTAVAPLQWTKMWRKATSVIQKCRSRLARLSIPFRAILRWTGSHVEIRIHDSTSNAAPAEFSVAVDDQRFRCLVKHRRHDCFRRLGGAAGIASALASDAEAGIRGDAADVRRRREAFGGNRYPRRRKPEGSGILLVLLVCAEVSLGFGIRKHGLGDGWYDGVSIFLAVLLLVAVTAVSNDGLARWLDRLATESDNISVNVVRGGRRQVVSIFDVAVGDVVVLKTGDVVPADGVFVRGHALQVDESSMTGEPHIPVDVDVDAENNPFLAYGVKVIGGYGHMLVTAVGTDTAWGEVMGSITREKTTEPTPLQKRVQGLTSSIGKVGIAVVMLTTRHYSGSTCTTDEQGKPTFDRQHVTFSVFAALVYGFQQAVEVAIPEGLTLGVTLILAFSMYRMVKGHALVRTLSACETMGSVTAICTDNAGLLSLNQKKVTEF